MDTSYYLKRNQSALEQALAQRDIPDTLAKAMAYSLLDGGKRIRALLCYAVGEALDVSPSQTDVVAAAIECLHSYSLIHDDLPAMDDDELRRGKPTNHIAFGEATAILAGDALQTLAFDLLAAADNKLADHQIRKILAMLTTAAGGVGMVGGQVLDMHANGFSEDVEQLQMIHRRKTGALIEAAVLCPAHCADQLSQQQESALRIYAQNLGLAFQVIDDVLDIEGSTEELGKPSGSDEAANKMTYPALIGLDESKHFAQKLYQEAIASLTSISDNTDSLKYLAHRVVHRSK